MNIEELMKYRNETVRKIAGMEELVWINPKEMNYSEYEKNLPVSEEIKMNIEELMKYRNETVRKIAGMEELVWINPKEMNYSEYEKNLPVSDEELKDAEERLARFAP